MVFGAYAMNKMTGTSSNPITILNIMNVKLNAANSFFAGKMVLSAAHSKCLIKMYKPTAPTKSNSPIILIGFRE